MRYLTEDVVVSGRGGQFQLDVEQWCALTSFFMPEPDKYGRALPTEEWKHKVRRDMFDADRMPVHLLAEQAEIFAGDLEFYTANIPEQSQFGKVLDAVDHEVDGEWKKFAITSKRGWIETDDVELLFLEEGKDIIRNLVWLCRRGPITVDLANRKTRPAPTGQTVKRRTRTK
jgi:hypothetical protein